MVSYVYDFTALIADDETRWNNADALGTPMTLTYSFLDADEIPTRAQLPPVETNKINTYKPFDQARRDATRDILDKYAAVTGLNFIEVDTPESSDINFLSNVGTSDVSWAYLPVAQAGYSTTSHVVISENQFYQNDADWQAGGWAYTVLIHELGHALGLDHPHEGTILAPALDNHNNTIMSYDWDWIGTYYPFYNYRDTLGRLDIDAVEYLYGDQTYDSYNWTAVWDEATQVFSLTGNDQDDVLIGTKAASILSGGAGADTLYGQEGDDQLIGGQGRDYLAGGDGDDIYVIDDTTDQIIEFFADGTDQIMSSISNSLENYGGDIEILSLIGDDNINAAGTEWNDYIQGNAGDNILIGYRGFDEFIGSDGDDLIYGGNSYDRVIYDKDMSDYTITYEGDATYVATQGSTDTLIGVEYIDFADQTLNLWFTQGTGSDNIAPTVSVSNPTVVVDEWVRLSDMIETSDANGDDILVYGIEYQSDVQNIYVDGALRTSEEYYETTSLSSITFQGSTSPQEQDLQIKVYDGKDWSAWETFTLSTVANTAPDLRVQDLTVAPVAWTRLSNVLDVTDINGHDIQQYEIYDADGRNSWYADGAMVNAKTGYQTSDLDGIWFQGDGSAGTQTLWVRGFDGYDWGAWDAFKVETKINTPPVLTVEDQTVEGSEWTRLSDIITSTDADNDAVLTYEIYDSEGTDNWYADGARVDASVGYQTSNLAGIWVQGDTQSSTQTLWVRGHDGQDWGAWDEFDLTTILNEAPVLTVEDQTANIREWTLLTDVLTSTDANGDAVDLYEIYDSTGGNNWYADGQTVDASVGYQTSDVSGIWFRADATASNQTLWVRGFDGEDWGAWDAFNLTTL